jgi:hypothetical protein
LASFILEEIESLLNLNISYENNKPIGISIIHPIIRIRKESESDSAEDRPACANRTI